MATCNLAMPIRPDPREPNYALCPRSVTRRRQDVVARFDGGRLSPEDGVLLHEVEVRLGMAGPLAVRLSDDGHPRRPKTKHGHTKNGQ